MVDQPGGAQSLSFLGVDFGSDVVSRVEMTNGNAALGPDQGPGINVVVMDDFVYGEPVSAVPEASTLMLLAGGLLSFGLMRRARTLEKPARCTAECLSIAGAMRLQL
jgi:hypothetical protein